MGDFNAISADQLNSTMEGRTGFPLNQITSRIEQIKLMVIRATHHLEEEAFKNKKKFMMCSI